MRPFLDQPGLVNQMSIKYHWLHNWCSSLGDVVREQILNRTVWIAIGCVQSLVTGFLVFSGNFHELHDLFGKKLRSDSKIEIPPLTVEEISASSDTSADAAASTLKNDI